MFRTVKLALGRLSLLSVMMAPLYGDSLPSFPGAEGFGAGSRGGRGGRVLLVTSLEDYDPNQDEPIPGTLRWACSSEGPRIVVFRVSGNIPLKRSLTIDKPHITLAGQSAPGDGICVKNYGTSVRASHVIIRYMRFRPGDVMGPKHPEGFAPDSLSLGSSEGGVRDVIFDHCSTSWAIDEVLSVSGADITDVTVQWCIISESLTKSLHKKGAHGYGSLLRCNGNLSFHHNIYAHHSSRSPRPGTYGEGSILLDFRNNLIYNSQGYTAKDPAQINYVGNYIKRPRGKPFSIGGETTHMFVKGNVQEGADQGNEDNWLLIANVEAINKEEEPFPVAPVTTGDASEVYEDLLERCGATLPERDAVDRRVIQGIRAGEGDLIDSQEEVGGWPEFVSLPPPADSDSDGMPDAWEKEHDLDPADPSDAAADRDGDGYTNIEEWLNAI